MREISGEIYFNVKYSRWQRVLYFSINLFGIFCDIVSEYILHLADDLPHDGSPDSMVDDGSAVLLTLPKNMNLDINSCRIELVCGDITDQEVDAIVNAANASLAGGGGVDGAIHRRGGSAIMKETNEKYPAGCPTGSAVISGAGNLKAQFVFHAVGPRWKGGTADEPELLRSAYRTCLELAVKYNCQSIAFPSISTGIYGYPIQQAAPVAIETVIKFIRETPEALRLVRFCLFSDADLEVYSKALEAVKCPVMVVRKMA